MVCNYAAPCSTQSRCLGVNDSVPGGVAHGYADGYVCGQSVAGAPPQAAWVYVHSAALASL